MAATALVLDLDGTVWDSRPWYAKTIARLSDGSASKVARELETGASVVQVAGKRGVTKARLARAAEEDGGSVKLYEEVLATLNALRARGTPIGVVTNLPGWLARPLLQSTGVGVYAPAIAMPKAGIRAKPQPHGIRKVLADLGLAADRGIWFVGDGAVDAEAAEAASVRFAWASFGYESQMPPGTRRVLSHFDEVLDL